MSDGPQHGSVEVDPDPMSMAQRLKNVIELQDSNPDPEEAEMRVIDVLETLMFFPMTLQVLKEVKIGHAVMKVKKAKDAEGRRRYPRCYDVCAHLIHSWKHCNTKLHRIPIRAIDVDPESPKRPVAPAAAAASVPELEQKLPPQAAAGESTAAGALSQKKSATTSSKPTNAAVERSAVAVGAEKSRSPVAAAAASKSKKNGEVVVKNGVATAKAKSPAVAPSQQIKKTESEEKSTSHKRSRSVSQQDSQAASSTKRAKPAAPSPSSSSSSSSGALSIPRIKKSAPPVMKPERRARTPTANAFTPKNLVIKRDAQLNNSGKRSVATSKARTPTAAASGPALKKQKLSANKERLSAPLPSRNRSTSPVSERMSRLKIKNTRSSSPPKKGQGRLRLHPLTSGTPTSAPSRRNDPAVVKKERPAASREKPAVSQKKRLRLMSSAKSEGKLKLGSPPSKKSSGVNSRRILDDSDDDEDDDVDVGYQQNYSDDEDDDHMIGDEPPMPTNGAYYDDSEDDEELDAELDDLFGDEDDMIDDDEAEAEPPMRSSQRRSKLPVNEHRQRKLGKSSSSGRISSSKAAASSRSSHSLSQSSSLPRTSSSVNSKLRLQQQQQQRRSGAGHSMNGRSSSSAHSRQPNGHLSRSSSSSNLSSRSRPKQQQQRLAPPPRRPMSAHSPSPPAKKEIDYTARTRPTAFRVSLAKPASGPVPSLLELCRDKFVMNFTKIGRIPGGRLPPDIVRQLLRSANAEQLMRFCKLNPEIIEDTEQLWKVHCGKQHNITSLNGDESWFDAYLDKEQEASDRLATWKAKSKALRAQADREKASKSMKTIGIQQSKGRRRRNMPKAMVAVKRSVDSRAPAAFTPTSAPASAVAPKIRKKKNEELRRLRYNHKHRTNMLKKHRDAKQEVVTQKRRQLEEQRIAQDENLQRQAREQQRIEREREVAELQRKQKVRAQNERESQRRLSNFMKTNPNRGFRFM